MLFQRGSGILLHITSLPGDYGIGDLGKSAYRFIDFLAASAQRYWQFLPTGPTSGAFGHSPYTSLSAFAGNPLLIDPDQLVDSGFLDRKDLDAAPGFSEYFVEFEKVVAFKDRLLGKAFEVFKREGADGDEFEQFCQAENWLDDYALFQCLREENQLRSWTTWPRPLASRDETTLAENRHRLAEPILFHKFAQFCFFTQWRRMHQYATQKGVVLIGDIPIYMGQDSADVWAHQDCFMLDKKTFQPTHVAGVPPDYFSDTGQRWGNPLYRWQRPRGTANERLYAWWQERFRHIFKTMDIVRIDHFRGFEAYWQIPAKEKTAMKGRWIKGPDRDFFEKMFSRLGKLPIIAEDLGIITPEVEKLRDEFGFPGMKILQFAFDSDEKNAYLPHNYTTSNCVVFTGTHDNDTTVGWFLSEKASQAAKERAVRYAHSDGKEIHWDFVRLALGSVASLALIPMQDILGFGTDCRMNLPSTSSGNWRWRCGSRHFTEGICQRLKDETLFYGRGP